MRTSYLVCYDICDDKRLRKVFQTMRGFAMCTSEIRRTAQGFGNFGPAYIQG